MCEVYLRPMLFKPLTTTPRHCPSVCIYVLEQGKTPFLPDPLYLIQTLTTQTKVPNSFRQGILKMELVPPRGGNAEASTPAASPPQDHPVVSFPWPLSLLLPRVRADGHHKAQLPVSKAGPTVHFAMSGAEGETGFPGPTSWPSFLPSLRDGLFLRALH